MVCLQLTGTETVEGQECNVWRLVVKEGGKRNVYTLWQSVATELPVRYEMFGYDSLLGSHYDKYYIDYVHVDAQKSLDDAIFTTPASECYFSRPAAVHGNQFSLVLPTQLSSGNVR